MTNEDPMEALADLLGALGHRDRLRLLLVLGDGECDVATLSKQAGLSQPRTSQHLALLRAHHLVASRKEGRRAYYALAQPDLLPWLGRAAAFLREDASKTADLVHELGGLAARLRGVGESG